MYYHFGESDSKNVITDYEVKTLKETTECINDVCNDLGINVKEFAKLLLKYSYGNDAYNAYVEILKYASQKQDCYVFDDDLFRKQTFEPEDDHFGVFECRLKIDSEPYLMKISKRIMEGRE